MQKLEFIEKAPGYYAVAIARVIRWSPSRLLSQEEIAASGSFSVREQLWWLAIEILAKNKLIEVVTDDFGPTLYRPKDGISEWLSGPAPIDYPWLTKVTNANDEWLQAALHNIFNQYALLRLDDEDFEVAAEFGWNPIPVEPSNPNTQTVAAAVQETLTSIQADNGYAVHAADERDSVVAHLKRFHKQITETGVIYARQIQAYALDPLGRIIARFGNAALGLSASAAKAAIFDWLKAHAGKLISLLMP